MHQNIWTPKLSTTTAIICMIGLLAVAAPITPAKPQLADLYHGLANIKRYRLNVLPVPAGLADAGMTRKLIISSWTKKLTEAGFELDDDESLPTLTLKFEFLTDADVPGGVTFLALLTVAQQMHFDHLDQSHLAPTYVQYLVGLESEDNLPKLARSYFDRMIDKFISNARRATALHQRGD